MLVAEKISEVREAVRQARQNGMSIGCVPTMGALHEGHVSLIRQAAQLTDFVVVTIFVNPTQFAPHEDFQKYPRPRERDLELCRQAGALLVFYPEVKEVYGDKPQVHVTVGELSRLWEGAARPGHFDGVATVVAKLFNIVLPDVACFGAKDYQQQSIIRALCRDLNFPVEIVTCPTVRTAEGLALSSRNAYLSVEEQQTALSLSRSLRLGAQLVQAGKLSLAEIREAMRSLLLEQADLVLDYVTIADPVTLQELNAYQPQMVALVAAKVGQTRLIDNLEIEWNAEA